MTKNKILLSLLIAAGLWLVMFSPWTAKYINFWIVMSISAVILITLAFCFGKEWRTQFCFNFKALMWSIGSAILLWAIFYFGDIISTRLFEFARPQIDSVYSMKQGENLTRLSLLLLLLIAPAEEIFWRGYIQRSLAHRFGRNRGFVLATAAYALVHIWSLNLMLILSALAVGCVWGWMYRQKANLVTLILSHALWDVAIFILFPTSN